MAVTAFVKSGNGNGRPERVLARYVAALGGSSAASRGAGVASATSAAQAIASFGATLGSAGLTPALQAIGLGHLVGQDRFDLLEGLLSELGGDGASLEDQAVLAALCDVFEELFPDDAESYEDLDAVTLDGPAVVGLIEQWVAMWAYHRMLPTLAEKFTHIADPTEAAERDRLLRDRIGLLVDLELEDQDPLAIDWRGPQGEAAVKRVINDLYEQMEDLEP